MNKSVIRIMLSGMLFTLTQTAHASNSALANPASVHCADNGGQLELRESEAGTEGICHFENGSQCEEWAYFKGTCNVGMRWVYHCNQGLSFTINFYDKEQALLEFADQEVRLAQERSGSGMRYSGGDITFTGKGLAGHLVMEDGNPYGENCHVSPPSHLPTP